MTRFNDLPEAIARAAGDGKDAEGGCRTSAPHATRIGPQPDGDGTGEDGPAARARPDGPPIGASRRCDAGVMRGRALEYPPIGGLACPARPGREARPGKPTTILVGGRGGAKAPEIGRAVKFGREYRDRTEVIKGSPENNFREKRGRDGKERPPEAWRFHGEAPADRPIGGSCIIDSSIAGQQHIWRRHRDAPGQGARDDCPRTRHRDAPGYGATEDGRAAGTAALRRGALPRTTYHPRPTILHPPSSILSYPPISMSGPEGVLGCGRLRRCCAGSWLPKL